MSSKHETLKSETAVVSRRVSETKREIERLKAEYQDLINRGINKSKIKSQDDTLEVVLKDEKSENVVVENNISAQNNINLNQKHKIQSRVNSNLNTAQRTNISNTRNRSKSREPLKKESPKKNKNYDVEEAKKYMKKQKERRIEERNSKLKNSVNTIEVRKQNLQELSKKTSEILNHCSGKQRDRSKSREKKQQYLSAIENYIPVPDLITSSHFESPEASSRKSFKIKQNFDNITIRSPILQNLDSVPNLKLFQQKSTPKYNLKHETAATVIQKFYKGFRQRKLYLSSKKNRKKLAKPVQNHDQIEIDNSDSQTIKTQDQIMEQDYTYNIPSQINENKGGTFQIQAQINEYRSSSEVADDDTNEIANHVKRIVAQLNKSNDISKNESEINKCWFQDSVKHKKEFPAWLESGPQTYPYNFISTVKRKLNIAVNTPTKKTSDVGVQISPTNSKKTSQQLKDLIETSARSFVYDKCVNLDLKNVEALQLRSLKNEFKVPKNDNTKNELSYTHDFSDDSDTSNNIPDISLESHITDSFQVHSATNNHSDISTEKSKSHNVLQTSNLLNANSGNAQNVVDDKSERRIKSSISTESQSNVVNSRIGSQKLEKPRISNADDFRLEINMDVLKKLKLQRHKLFNGDLNNTMNSFSDDINKSGDISEHLSKAEDLSKGTVDKFKDLMKSQADDNIKRSEHKHRPSTKNRISLEYERNIQQKEKKRTSLADVDGEIMTITRKNKADSRFYDNTRIGTTINDNARTGSTAIGKAQAGSTTTYDQSRSASNTHDNAQTEPTSHDKSRTGWNAHDNERTEPTTHDKSRTGSNAHGNARIEHTSHDKSRTGSNAHDNARTEQTSHDKSRTGSNAHDNARTEQASHDKSRTGSNAHDNARTEQTSHDKSRTGSNEHDNARTASTNYDRAHTGSNTHDKAKTLNHKARILSDIESMKSDKQNEFILNDKNHTDLINTNKMSLEYKNKSKSMKNLKTSDNDLISSKYSQSAHDDSIISSNKSDYLRSKSVGSNKSNNLQISGQNTITYTNPDITLQEEDDQLKSFRHYMDELYTSKLSEKPNNNVIPTLTLLKNLEPDGTKSPVSDSDISTQISRSTLKSAPFTLKSAHSTPRSIDSNPKSALSTQRSAESNQKSAPSSLSFATLKTATPDSHSTSSSKHRKFDAYSSNFSSCASPLIAPPLALKTHKHGKQTVLLKPGEKSSVETVGNPNQIHVKFEAELHLLNDFNDHMKQFMTVEKSLLDLQNTINTSKTTICESRDTQTSIITRTSTETKTSSSKNITEQIPCSLPVSINYSRGSAFVNQLQSFNQTGFVDNSVANFDDSTLSTGLEISEIQENSVDGTFNNFAVFDNTMNSGNIQAGISLGMFEQLIKDEDARIENLKTILKIREKALLDRTKGELAWLEVQKKHLLETGQLHEASLLKKKQRGIIIKLQHEKHEMQKLKQIQKTASKERKTILKEQRNMIKSQLSSHNMLTKIKRTPSKERRHSGPVKVYNYHRETLKSEASISRKSSVAEEIVYASCSESQSVVSRITDGGMSDGIESLRDEANGVVLKAMGTDNKTENARKSLLMREAALQKRRKAAEDLLQWHQKLLEEERKITELEMAASNIINEVPSVTIENPVHEKYHFKGAQLNLLWKNMTGREEIKFNDLENYSLSQIALERFCKDAKKIKNTSKNLEKSGTNKKEIPLNKIENKTNHEKETSDFSDPKTIQDTSIISFNKTDFDATIEDENTDIELEDGIKHSKSTLNEIMQNISSITDEISELYKLSSVKESIRSPSFSQDSENLEKSAEENVSSQSNVEKSSKIVTESHGSMIDNEKLSKEHQKSEEIEDVLTEDSELANKNKIEEKLQDSLTDNEEQVTSNLKSSIEGESLSKIPSITTDIEKSDTNKSTIHSIEDTSKNSKSIDLEDDAERSHGTNEIEEISSKRSSTKLSGKSHNKTQSEDILSEKLTQNHETNLERGSTNESNISSKSFEKSEQISNIEEILSGKSKHGIDSEHQTSISSTCLGQSKRSEQISHIEDILSGKSAHSLGINSEHPASIGSKISSTCLEPSKRSEEISHIEDAMSGKSTHSDGTNLENRSELGSHISSKTLEQSEEAEKSIKVEKSEIEDVLSERSHGINRSTIGSEISSKILGRSIETDDSIKEKSYVDTSSKKSMQSLENQSAIGSNISSNILERSKESNHSIKEESRNGDIISEKSMQIQDSITQSNLEHPSMIESNISSKSFDRGNNQERHIEDISFNNIEENASKSTINDELSTNKSQQSIDIAGNTRSKSYDEDILSKSKKDSIGEETSSIVVAMEKSIQSNTEESQSNILNENETGEMSSSIKADEMVREEYEISSRGKVSHDEKDSSTRGSTKVSSAELDLSYGFTHSRIIAEDDVLEEKSVIEENHSDAKISDEIDNGRKNVLVEDDNDLDTLNEDIHSLNEDVSLRIDGIYKSFKVIKNDDEDISKYGEDRIYDLQKTHSNNSDLSTEKSVQISKPHQEIENQSSKHDLQLSESLREHENQSEIELEKLYLSTGTKNQSFKHDLQKSLSENKLEKSTGSDGIRHQIEETHVGDLVDTQIEEIDETKSQSDLFESSNHSDLSDQNKKSEEELEDDMVHLKDDISNSKSALNEIIQNINSISDDISELYKISASKVIQSVKYAPNDEDFDKVDGNKEILQNADDKSGGDIEDEENSTSKIKLDISDISTEEQKSDDSPTEKNNGLQETTIITSNQEIVDDLDSEENASEERNKDSPKTTLHVDVKKRVSEILADSHIHESKADSLRVQDLYCTTYDLISPDNSPESGSPGNSLSEKGLISAQALYEAEQLLKKQLAIEQEIKQLQQQQKEQLPYLYMREIPNKPPPPYKPPVKSITPTPTTVLPSSIEQINSVTPKIAKILYRSYQKKELLTSVLPANLTDKSIDRICYEFIFDVCKTMALEHYKHFEEKHTVSWMISNISKGINRPLSEKGLEDMFNKKLKDIFGFEKVPVKESMIIKWSRKKRDHVDELLVLELQAEESEWTNYDQDELIVKDEVTNDIFNMLLAETAVVFDKFITKKMLNNI